MTLFEIMREVIRNLQMVREGTATGGTTTTLIDTNLSDPDDYYNGGVLFIDLASPTVVQITDWALLTKTFTIPTVAEVTSGKTFTVANERFPIDVLKNVVNRALRNEIGKIGKMDTSLTIVQDQKEYTLPSGVSDVRRVEYGDADSGYKVHYGWKEEYGKIRFLSSYPSTGNLRLHYGFTHVALSAYSDLIDDMVDREYLITAATYLALSWRKLKVGDNEPENNDLFNLYAAELARMRAIHRSKLLTRDPIHARL